MKKLFNFWNDLPNYFKVFVIIIALLNLAVVSGLESVSNFKDTINSNDYTALMDEMKDVTVQDGRLTAEALVIDINGFQIGINTVPDSSNNIVFAEENILVNYGGNSQQVNYEQDGSIIVYLNQAINDYLVTTFVVQSIQRVFIILLIISLIYLFSHLVFKISIKQIGVISNTSLMLVILMLVYSIVYGITRNDFLSFTIASLSMGTIHLYKNKTKIDQRVTKMYLGEGV